MCIEMVGEPEYASELRSNPSQPVGSKSEKAFS